MRRRAKARRRNTLSTDEGDLLRCDADQVLSEHPTLAKRNFYPIFSLFFAVLRFCHCLALGCAKATQNRIGASRWVSSADFFERKCSETTGLGPVASQFSPKKSASQHF